MAETHPEPGGRKRSILIAAAKGTAALLLLSFFAVAGYGYFLSKDIDKRFSGRRWSVPSRVYSDSMLLYPGERIDLPLLIEKLTRLGYRRTDMRPRQRGEMRVKNEAVELFLKDVQLPALKREGFPVRIDVTQGAIASISRLISGEPLYLLELAPEELMLFFGSEREQRRLISISQVPEHVKRAFLAAEDVRFYHHRGLDPRGIVRALYVNLRYRDVRQGGSTITQQLAKNYFLTPERTLSRKLKEMLTAVVMEVMFEKDEILEMYFNEIYLGQKGSVAVNGLGEASHFYFGKSVEELLADEGALIAGLVRAPNLYSPYVDKERCRARRDQVLASMAAQGWLSPETFQSAVRNPIEPVGFQTYGEKAPYFIDDLSRQMQALYSSEDLSRLGISIFTTLDTEVQQAAEKALLRGLKRLEEANPELHREEPGQKLQGAVLVMQPKTGYILAMVGGRNYAASQFNRTTQAKRQPGSAFKPFVFLAGMDHGFTPVSRLANVPTVYEVDGEQWAPRNASSLTEEEVSLRTALAASLNVATVDLAMKIGVEEIVQGASDFGFTTPLKPVPSIALGTMELIPLELARAYCAFAADGMLPHPLSIKDVFDEKGKVLDQRHMTVQRVTTPEKAFIMSSLLRSVVTEGTARSIQGLGLAQPIAGKTGTTDNSRDAWFIGYTPDLLALVWIGFDDGASIHGTGASAALPIWADLMKHIPQHLSGNWFRTPPGVMEKTVCAQTGQLAAPLCPNPVKEHFLADHAPTESCQQHDAMNSFRRVWDHVEEFLKEQ